MAAPFPKEAVLKAKAIPMELEDPPVANLALETIGPLLIRTGLLAPPLTKALASPHPRFPPSFLHLIMLLTAILPVGRSTRALALVLRVAALTLTVLLARALIRTRIELPQIPILKAKRLTFPPEL